MSNHKYLIFLFFAVILGAGFVFLNISEVKAEATMPKVVLKYPISELGNCQNKNDCKLYCGLPSHYLACTDFGEKNNLISKEKAVRARKFVDILKSEGPGRCKDEADCKNYCNKTGNQKECFIFSMKNGLISAEKLKELKNGVEQLRSGFKQMPQEMKACVIKNGADIVNKIESGKGEAIDLVEIGSTLQNCAASYRDALLEKQMPSGAPGCFKSVISTISGKTKNGGSIGQSDIMSAIVQNCLPAGTKIPQIPGGAINMELLQKVQQYYGDKLSPQQLDALKKIQQNQGAIPQGTVIPPSNNSLKADESLIPEDNSGMGM